MRSSWIVCVALMAGVIASSCRSERPETGPGNGTGLDLPPAQGGSIETLGGPPIMGGTLLVTADSRLAFASDPDRDRIVIVDLVQRSVFNEIVLDEDSHPGRAVEDGAGNVHVVLRGKTSILSLDRQGKELSRRTACGAPRGIDYDPASDQLVIACLGGELVRMGAAAGAPIDRTVRLVPDLRDVVVDDDRVYVSVFRSARVLVLDQADELIHEGGPAPLGETVPTVGWRMTRWPEKGVFLSHQRSSTAEILVGDDAPPSGYGEASGAPPIVETGGSAVDEYGDVVEMSGEPATTLPVDADVNEAGTEVAVVAAASDTLTIMRSPLGLSPMFGAIIPGEPIAVQFANNEDQETIVQTREPSTLVVVALDMSISDTIDLGGDDVSDVGHAIFHRTPDGPRTFGVVCASCHPEGREDGHVWNFFPLGPRRTQSLLGGISSTKPFHWDGDQEDMTDLLHEVFEFRMGNPELSDSDIKHFASWVDTLADLPVAKASGAELDQGQAAFVKGGCDACHSGERLSSGVSADVGTGGKFQIPSLVGVRYRAPYMHDGCALTLADRFGECGGSAHGDADQLSDGELAALISHLETL